MRFRGIASIILGTCCVSVFMTARAGESEPVTAMTNRVVAVKPNYLPPSGLVEFLGARQLDGTEIVEWTAPDGIHSVNVRRNDAANLLLLSGAPDDVEAVEKLVKEADVPPRQIAIEAKIVEINQSKMKDLGLDWDQIMKLGGPRIAWNSIHSDNDSDQRTHYRDETVNPQGIRSLSEARRDSDGSLEVTEERLMSSASLDLSRVLTIVDETGAGTVRNAPRILTLNNRRATILDGQRVTYVARYSSYTNLFVTDSMDAGLTLNVLPSLGESGYITLQIRAELTHLVGDVSGSPAKDGQMVENTVIVKDGETVLLGGFQRTTERTVKKRFPLLGHVLPFLFSRESKISSTTETFVVLTPRVVDFSVALDEQTKEAVEGK
jgi:type IV pilus assembly protein PilQ